LGGDKSWQAEEESFSTGKRRVGNVIFLLKRGFRFLGVLSLPSLFIWFKMDNYDYKTHPLNKRMSKQLQKSEAKRPFR
jgi:hypothetical protein